MKIFDQNSFGHKSMDRNSESAETPAASLSEQSLDKLMAVFFEAEMPAEIKALAQSIPSSRPVDSTVIVRPAQTVQQSRGISAWFGVATAAATLVVAAVIGVNLNSSGPETPIAGLMTAPSLENPLDKDQTTVELFDLVGGAVEQRTNLRWKNVSTSDPGSGETIQWIMPELEIEIFDLAEGDVSTTVRG